MEARAAPRAALPSHGFVDPPEAGEAWTVMHMIRWSAAYLERKGVEGARLDAELALAHVLGIGRLQLYLQFDRPLTAEELSEYKPLLKRRGGREPLQYVLGSVPFRTIELDVDGRVLIPRPETEYLVDVIKGVAGQDARFRRALDVGTGSGAIALSLVAEGLADTVVATDLSAEALALATANADKNRIVGVVDFRQGRLTGPVAGEVFDLVASNLPYVPDLEWEATLPEVRDWEPALALRGGADGLDLVRALIPCVPQILVSGGWLALELASPQTQQVAESLEAEGSYAEVRVENDLADRSRYVLARKN